MHNKNDNLPQPLAPAAAAAPTRNGSLSDRVQSLRLADRTPQAGNRGAIIPWTLAAIFLVASLAFGYRAYRVTPEAASSPETEKPQGPWGAGSASREVASSGQVVLESKGNMIALHQIQLSPQVGGEIIWLDPNFQEGALYKKGAKLAEIDPVIFQAQVKSAEAALRVAEINQKQVETGSTLKDIDAAKAQLKNLVAKLEVSRIDERTKLSSGIGSSRDEREKATAQVAADEAAVVAQKASVTKLEWLLEEQRLVTRSQVHSAQANLDQAVKQLKNCTIVAPTTGIVLTKKAELGGYVNPLAFGNVAGYLCEMADLSKIEVELSIPERDFAKVIVPKDGNYQICVIMPEAFQNDARFLQLHPNGYDGYVSRVMPMADRAKSAMTVRVRVRVQLEEAGFYLKPDMSVSVKFKSETTKDTEKD